MLKTLTICAAMLVGFAAPAAAAHYTLDATPSTVAWGHYDATSKPVLTIASGDSVTFHTLITSNPPALEKAGVAPGDVQPGLRAIYANVTDKGPADIS